MVKVTVYAAGRKSSLAPDLPVTLEVPGKSSDVATVADVKAAFVAKYPNFYASRQKVTLKGERKALSDETILGSIGVVDGGQLEVKDLGPQISWMTVFLIEYVGPLIIHPLLYYYPNVFYGGPVQHSMLQRYVFFMVMLHFVKRELETLFVHRFSHGTMPFTFVFRNSAHYHILGGASLAYAVYSPTYAATSPYIRGTIRDSPNFLMGYALIWLFAELSNLKTHLTLRNLRPAGTKKRAIPYGFGFNLVSCPNYAFEILGWTVISLMTGSYCAWVFNLAGAYTMVIWAVKKHKNYKKEFGKEYPKRNVIFPFIL